MPDIGASELLIIVVVAILVIGPKDMPTAMRAAGRWIGKMRKLSGHFRSGLDAMIREAEMEEMEKKWKAQNEKIMREHPSGKPKELEEAGAYPAAQTGSGDKGDKTPASKDSASKDGPGKPASPAPASAEGAAASTRAKAPAAKSAPAADPPPPDPIKGS